jgi:hypothetical protein
MNMMMKKNERRSEYKLKYVRMRARTPYAEKNDDLLIEVDKY